MIISEQVAADIVRSMQGVSEADVEQLLFVLWCKYEAQGVSQETFAAAVKIAGRTICDQGEQMKADGHALNALGRSDVWGNTDHDRD
jgi:hypothetical protein